MSAQQQNNEAIRSQRLQRRPRSRWLRFVGVGLLGLVSLALLALVWLVSPPGLRWATTHIEAMASEAVGAEVQMDGLRLRLPLRLSLEQFRVGDKADPYLVVESLNIRVSARALARRTLLIRTVSLERVMYRDWPEQERAEKDRDPRPEWQGLPDSIGPIRHFQVGSIQVRVIEWQDLMFTVSGDLDIDLEADQGQTAWTLHVSGLPVDGEEHPAFSGTVRADVDWSATREYALPVMSMRVRCDKLWVQDMPLRDLMIELNSDGKQIDYSLQGEGERPQVWQALAEGGIDFAHQSFAGFRLSTFSVEYGELMTRLVEPLVVQRQEGDYHLDEMRLQIGEGTLVAAGHFGLDAMDIGAEIFDVPLSMFGFGGVSPAQGDFQGNLHVHGDPAEPQVDLSFLFSDLMPANPELWEGPPAEFLATFSLAAGRLNSQLKLSGPAGKPGTLKLDTPLVLSFVPFYVEWPPQGEISGQLQAETDLSALAQLFVLDVHRVKGLFRVDLALSGEVQDPALTGMIVIDDGQYEHDLLGTRLRDVSLAFSGERNQLRLDHFRATDGRGGSVLMNGGIYLNTQEDYPFEGNVELSDFRLMRNDTMTAIGNGRIQWTGNRLASLVSGTVSVGPAELAIPERLPAAMIDLDVIELDGEEPPSLVERAPGTPHQMTLDVEVAIPDRFFVRGRGLDSEWGGDIRIRGPIAEPVLTGALSVIRGRFVFFGRRLGLTRGIITFDGSVPPQPGLDVVAEARTRDMTALMRLSGAVDAPLITLESIPTYPQDEILARLLFRRGADRITPFQALTIAQAVNQLRGGGSAFDVMGHTRRFLRVDQIELRDEDQDGEMTLAVGKYISDRIFVELERGGGEDSTRIAVEVEITPTLRLDSQVGTEADAGVGLSWHWDF